MVYKIHKRFAYRVIKLTPVQYLYDFKCISFLLGRVLNRFSKDIGFMDEVLPFQFLELFTVSVGSNYAMHQLALYRLVVAKVPCHHDGGLRGKLLPVHSCHHHSRGTVIFSLVLLAHIKTRQKT